MDRLVLVWGLALGLAAAAPAAGPLDDAKALEAAMQEAIRRAEPSVVCVLVSRSDAYHKLGDRPAADAPGRLGSFDPQTLLRGPHRPDPARQDQLRRLDLSDPEYVPESYGSGVVIGPGLVLTPYHVVREATKVFVRWADGPGLEGPGGCYADIHAADPRSDLAVLRLLAPPAGLRALPLGRGEALRKGQFVLALAHPHAAGFRDGSASASWGIVSNLRRRAPGTPREEERTKTLHHYGTLVQTDVRINLGCSGGALLNLQGEFVALTSALAAVTGVDTPGGFAVPLTPGLRRIVDVLREGKEVEYGFLGVSFDPNYTGPGVRITTVALHSPAARAGLTMGSVLIKVNDTPVNDADEVFLAVGTALAGNKVRLTVRDGLSGAVQEREAALAKFYVPGPVIASVRPPARGGLRVDYVSTLVGRLPEGGNTRLLVPGVVVREVAPGSAADKAGLQTDKVITQVNGRRVGTPAEFYQEMARAKDTAVLTLSDNETVTLSLR